MKKLNYETFLFLFMGLGIVLVVSALIYAMWDGAMGPDSYEIEGDICHSIHKSFFDTSLYNCESGKVYEDVKEYKLLKNHDKK